MQPPGSTKQSTHRWWCDRVLLQATHPAPFGSHGNADAWYAQLSEGLAQILCPTSIGLWLHTPDSIAPGGALRTISINRCTPPVVSLPAGLLGMVEKAHARGLRVLMDAPAPDSAAWDWAKAHRATDLCPQPLVCDPATTAPALHTRLTCAMKTAGRQMPAWTLPLASTQASALQVSDNHRKRLATALQLSVRGTPVVAWDEVQCHGTTRSTYTQLMQWRCTHPALTQGSMKLLPVHGQLLAFVREHEGSKVLCVFNWSDRYVREPLPTSIRNARLLAGSGLCGGRIVDRHIDCDPWGGLFAALG